MKMLYWEELWNSMALKIQHIDNPILICEFEDNKAYLNKIKTALTNLVLYSR